MAYDPSSLSELDRYHEALDRSGDPHAAWEAAWGEEAPAREGPEAKYARLLEAGGMPERAMEGDPAEAYTRLLTEGCLPHEAWETAYGEKRPLKGRPAGVTLGFVPEVEVRTESVWFYSHGTPEAGEGYTSYVYTVGYRYKGTGKWMWTWARVDIPDVDWSTINTLGVVLVVEGDLSHTVGVSPTGDASESWYQTESRLAGGKLFGDESPAEVDASLPYRDPPEGTAILVVSFTQPGRGPADLRPHPTRSAWG